MAHIEVVNTTADTLYALFLYEDEAISGGPAPDWIHVGNPELPLFGQTLCDGSHYDPFGKQGVPVAPGSKATYDWTGAYAELVGVANSQSACFQEAFASPGSYPARACARPADSADAGPILLGEDAGASHCVDFTVVLPAAGTVTSSASW